MSAVAADLSGFKKIIMGFDGKFEVGEVFETFLDYVIAGHCVDGSIAFKPNERFERQHIAKFYDLYASCVAALDRCLAAADDWCDFFGGFYEEHIASKSKKSGNGIFFTPQPVCDAMAENFREDMGGRKGRVNDPACGSGRTLLAYHAATGGGNYFVAEDLDRFACKMCVCNFLFHGCDGEVVWHNSLEASSWMHGWRVNRYLNCKPNLIGGPHVEELPRREVAAQPTLGVVK